VSRATYDGLFNTVFIVISLTVVPFVSREIASPTRAYQIWAALSFDLPVVATIILWGSAVFANSIRYRVASWSALIYQIARTPFVIAVDILGITTFVQIPLGQLMPYASLLEIALSLLPAFLVMKQYCYRVATKPPKKDYIAWLAPIIALGAYTYVISLFISYYSANL